MNENTSACEGACGCGPARCCGNRSNAERTQFRHVACQSALAAPCPLLASQKSRNLATSELAWDAESPAVMAQTRSGAKPLGRREPFFDPRRGVSLWVVGLEGVISLGGVGGVSLGEGSVRGFRGIPRNSAEFRGILRSRSAARRRSAASSGKIMAPRCDKASAVRPINSGSTPALTMSAINAATSFI